MLRVVLLIGIMFVATTSSYAQKLFGGSFERQAAKALAGQPFSYRFACTFYADEAGKDALPAQLKFRIIRKSNNIVVRELLASKDPNPVKKTYNNDCAGQGATATIALFSVVYSYEMIVLPTEFSDPEGFYVINEAPPVPRATSANIQSSKLVLYHWFSPQYLFEKLDDADDGRVATGLSGEYAFICKAEGKSLRFELTASPSVKYFSPKMLDLTARASTPLTEGVFPFQNVNWKAGYSTQKPNGEEVYVVDSKPKFDNNSESTFFEAWAVPPQTGIYSLAFVTQLQRNGQKLSENSLEILTEVNECKRTPSVGLQVLEVGTGKAANASFCRNKPIELKAIATEQDLTFQWYRDQQPIAGATSTTLKIDDTGQFFLKAKREGTCSDSRTMTVNAVAINCDKNGPPAIMGNNIYDLVHTVGHDGFINQHAFRATYYTPIADLSKMPNKVKATIYRKRDNAPMEDLMLIRNSAGELTHLLDRLCDKGIDSVQQISYDGSTIFKSDIYSDQQGYYVTTEPVCCRANADNIAQNGSSVVTYLELGPANKVEANNSIQRGHTVDLNIPFAIQTCVGELIRVYIYAGNRENITAQFAGFAELMAGNETNTGTRQMAWVSGFSAENFTGNQRKFTVEPRRNGLMVLMGVAEKPGVFAYRLKIDGTMNGQIYSSIFQEFRLEVNDCSPPPKPSVFVSKVGKPLIAASTELCQDSLVQLNLHHFRKWATLQWYREKVPIPNATDSLLIVPKNVSGLYTCRIKMLRQCPEIISTEPTTITYLARPNVSILANSKSFCEGQKLPLAAQSNVIGGAFQWFFEDKIQNGAIQTNFEAAIAGAYSLRVVDSKGCSNISSPFRVTVNSLPKAEITSKQNYVCEGQNLNLSASTATGNSYQWYRNTQTTGSNQQQLAIIDDAKYAVKVTNSFGCVNTSIGFQVRIQKSPSVAIQSPGTQFCQEKSLVLTAITTTNKPKYEWYKENTLQNDATNPTYQINAAGNYVVRVTDTLGCIGTSLQQKISVYPQPNLAITSAQNYVCEGQNLTLTASPLAGHTYEWLRDSQTVGTGNQQLTITDKGTYSVKVVSPVGCTSVATPVQIRQINSPTVSIAAPANQFCEGSTLVLTAQTVALSPKYQWFADSTLLKGSINLTFMAVSKGNYSVQVIDINGCIGKSTTQPLTVNPLPKAEIISAQKTVCQGLTTPLTVEYNANYVYEWQQNGKNIPAKTNVLNVIETGNYTVKVTTLFNCSLTSQPIFIQQVKNPVVAILAPVLRVCSGTQLLLTAVSENIRKYKWLKDGTIILEDTQPVFDVKQTGNYIVMVSDTNGCLASSSSVLAQVLLPIIVQIDSIPDFCGYAFEPIPIVVSPASGQLSGRGIVGNTFAPRVAGVGKHDITYTVKGDLACLSGSAQRTITVKEAPYLDLGNEVELYRGTATKLNADMGKGYTYQWTPQVWIDDPTIARPKVDPDSTGYYTVLAISADNCASEDSVKIVVVQRIMVPDIFTPNNDGHNDTWRIIGIEAYPEISVTIFDRWGSVVFYGKGSDQKPFDGTFRGEALPEGMYVYVIQAKPNGHTNRGSFMIGR
jgi:gliding motility-associated-like protein